MDLVIATAIFGGYDRLRPTKTRSIPHVCFTDGSVVGAEPWVQRLVSPQFNNRRLDAYYYKILAHRHLDNECVLWIDGNYSLQVNPLQFAQAYLSDSDIATFEHFVRDCTYQEAEACIRFGRLTPSREAIEAQMASYRAEGFPEHAGMIEGCILLRRYTPWVKDFCELWWEEAMKHSSRFQLSFNYLMWKHGLDYNAIPVGVYRNSVRQSRHLKGDP